MLSANEAKRLLARVPNWEAEEISEVEPLTGGLTNQSFRFSVRGEPYVLRVSGENTAWLGIDRAAEFAATSAAAQAGLAPEVIAFLPPEGHLVLRWDPGAVWTAADLKEPERLQRVADTLRRVHRLPPIPYDFSPFRDIDQRLATAADLGIPLPTDTADLVRHAATLEARYWRIPTSHTGLCHNDPFAGNFLGDDTGVRLIDWEYAGMGDIFYDLACFGVYFPPEGKDALLQAYFNQVTDAAREKLAAMHFVMTLWNWTWALLQTRSPHANAEHTRMEQGLLESARRQL